LSFVTAPIVKMIPSSEWRLGIGVCADLTLVHAGKALVMCSVGLDREVDTPAKDNPITMIRKRWYVETSDAAGRRTGDNRA
jgi:hypothetical protein